MQVFNENSSFLWKLIMLLKSITEMKIHNIDENSLLIILMKRHYLDEKLSLQWNIITQMKDPHFDKNALLC